MPKLLREDYKPCDYLISKVDLYFHIEEKVVYVTGRLYYAINTAQPGAPLILNGKDLKITNMSLNGEIIPVHRITITEDHDGTQVYSIAGVPKTGQLVVQTEQDPWNNKSCAGLYISKDILVTKCESEYFRRIMLYIDRPDNLAVFTTMIYANKEKFPVLLSNGNLVEKGDLPNNRHFAKYEDPFPKPSYLFALVAAQLAYRHDTFTTQDNRIINLYVYSKEKDVPKTAFALQSMKSAMQWEEETYGLSYDLDNLYLVGVEDYNSGATENKGLLIFNSARLLADHKITTDQNQRSINGTIAHELFHNYAGNRVTIRSWFHLVLKEGLVSYKEQDYSGIMYGYHENRIGKINELRSSQFPQDAGPLAHAPCPHEMECVRSVYTTTTYYKGAQLFKMLETILTRPVFLAGAKKYFNDYDGTAAVIEEFIGSLEEVSGRNLQQFLGWFYQKGTPELYISDEYDVLQQRYTLHIKQKTEGSNNRENPPLMIPVTIGLLDASGTNMLLDEGNSTVLLLTKAEQSFVFNGILSKPVPSILRDFSAPVKIKTSPISATEQMFLFMYDTDPVNRWLAGQAVKDQLIANFVLSKKEGQLSELPADFLKAYRNILADNELTCGMKALLLEFPDSDEIISGLDKVDLDALLPVIDYIKMQLSVVLFPEWFEFYKETRLDNEDMLIAESASRRKLQNLCLKFLMQISGADQINDCMDQFINATNMTNEYSALSLLVGCNYRRECGLAEQALKIYHERWKDEPVALINWITSQSIAQTPNVVAKLEKLLLHPSFDIHTPNHVLRLYIVFAMYNTKGFHNIDGSGYKFVADGALKVDTFNAETAAKLVDTFAVFGKFDVARRKLMLGELQRINACETLSPNCKSSIARILATAAPEEIPVFATEASDKSKAQLVMQ